MKDGSVQLYDLVHLRPCGLVNIPRIFADLPDGDTAHMAAGRPPREQLRYIHLFDFMVIPELPLTMLTVDEGSRLRLWGLRIHKHNGKLSDLRLVVDGGQPLPLRLDLETGSALCVAEPGEAEEEVARRKAEAEKERVAKEAARKVALEAAAKKGKLAMQAEADKVAREPAKPSVLDLPPAHSWKPQVTSICIVKEMMALPTFDRFRWMELALKRRHEALVAELTAEANSVGTFLTAPFLTRPGSGPGDRDDPKPLNPDGADSSDEDVDPPEVVQARLDLRPSTPPLPMEGETNVPFTHIEGNTFVFCADGGGWIRCVDMKASVAASLELMAPIPVHIDDPVVKYSTEAEQALEAEDCDDVVLRGGSKTGVDTMRRVSNVSRRSSSNRIQSDGIATSEVHRRIAPKSVIGSIVAKPEIWRTVGAWRASQEAVLSLVPTTSPPGLVSADASKDVKVWSTCGELWAHFSLRLEDGVPAPATLWPPPHVLASQRALMEIAKGLTEKLGMVTSKKGIEVPTASKEACMHHKSVKMGKQNTGEKMEGHGRSLERRASRMRAVTSMPHVNTPSQSSCATPSKVKGITDAGLLEASVRSNDLDFDDDGEDIVTEATEEEEDEKWGKEPSRTPAAKEARREANRERMVQMVRQHAFSSGFTSYKRFNAFKEVTASTSSLPEARRPVPRGEPTLQELESKRNDFFTRRASSFGLQLSPLASEEQNWQNATRDLGSKSSSEGALVRFANHAVNGMTKTVRDQLGVDVRTTTRAAIKRHSFVGRLDVGNVGPGVTMRAADKIFNSSAPADLFSNAGNKRRMSTLQSLSAPGGGRKG
jgi:hypothetical protein